MVSANKTKKPALKEHVQLYSALYVGCKSRQADLSDFLCHENHDYLPGFSNYVSMRKSYSKLYFLEYFPSKMNSNTTIVKYEQPTVDGYITVLC